MSPRTQKNLHQAWWTIFPIFLISLLLCRFAAGVLLYIQPTLYESAAIIDEDPPPSVAPGKKLAVGHALSTALTERLDLTSRWKLSEDEVKQQLEDILTIRRSDDGLATEFICKHTFAADARDIAAHAAKNYPGWRRHVAMNKNSIEQQQAAIKTQLLLERLTKLKRNRGYARAKEEIRSDDVPKKTGHDVIARLTDQQSYGEPIQKIEAELAAQKPLLPTSTLPAAASIAVFSHAEVGKNSISPNVPLGFLWANIVATPLGLAFWWLYIAKVRRPLSKSEVIEHNKMTTENQEVDY